MFSFGNQLRDFLINHLRSLIRIRTLSGHFIEHQAAVIFMEYLIAQALAHSLLNHHITGNFSRFSQIRTSSSSNSVIAVNQLLSDSSAHCPSQNILKLVNICVALIFWRQEPCYSTSTAARNDRDLMDWVGIRQDMTNNCVASFVISSQLFLVIVHYLSLALWTNCHTLKRLS